MKSKQSISKMPRIQVINSLDEFNRPPTMADLVDGKAPALPNVPGGKKEKKVPEFLKRQAAMKAGYKMGSTRGPSTTQSVSDDVSFHSNPYSTEKRLKLTFLFRIS